LHRDWLFSSLGLHGVSVGAVDMPRLENVENRLYCGLSAVPHDA